MTIEEIISGGQTGVDRAALDVAIELDIPHSGWCPRGRRAEDGNIPDRYNLTETPESDYLQRTEWNVRDTDATLILSPGEPEGGTRATREYARDYSKPCLIIDPGTAPNLHEFSNWINDNDIHRLNIAGPRASKQPAIYEMARHYLLSLLRPA